MSVVCINTITKWNFEFEIRVLLKHYWKQSYKAASAARIICEVEGEGVVSERVTQWWFQHFNIGEENTKDLPCSGRRKLWDIENIHRVLEENSKKVFVGCQNTIKDTIHHQIKTLGKSYRSWRSVPHELTPSQAQCRVDISSQLVGNSKDDRFIRRIVTCDDKWVYYCIYSKQACSQCGSLFSTTGTSSWIFRWRYPALIIWNRFLVQHESNS